MCSVTHVKLILHVSAFSSTFHQKVAKTGIAEQGEKWEGWQLKIIFSNWKSKKGIKLIKKTLPETEAQNRLPNEANGCPRHGVWSRRKSAPGTITAKSTGAPQNAWRLKLKKIQRIWQNIHGKKLVSSLFFILIIFLFSANSSFGDAKKWWGRAPSSPSPSVVPEKVSHFVKNHEKSSIWLKLATLRANYDFSAFSSTFQQKTARSVSFHESKWLWATKLGKWVVCKQWQFWCHRLEVLIRRLS